MAIDDATFQVWYAANRNPALHSRGYEHAMFMRWAMQQLLAERALATPAAPPPAPTPAPTPRPRPVPDQLQLL